MPDLGCWWVPVGLVAFAAVAWVAGRLFAGVEERPPSAARPGFPVVGGDRHDVGDGARDGAEDGARDGYGGDGGD